RQVLPAPPSSTSGEAASTSAPAATTKAVTYTVLFDVDNHDGELMPQMTAQVSFVTAKVSQVIVVPLAALLSAGGKYMARVMASDGTVHSRPLRLGVRSRLDAEVLDGLVEGESLVIAEQVREAGLSWLQW